MKSAHTLYEALNRRLIPIENVAAVFAGVAMVLAMALSSLDAIMRYALDEPLVFQFYFTSNYLMVALCTMALAWGFRNGGFIRVTMLTAHLPPVARSAVLRLGLVAGAALLLLLTWTSGAYVVNAFRTNQVYVEELNWPVAWSWIWIPLGCGLLMLRVLLMAISPIETFRSSEEIELET